VVVSIIMNETLELHSPHFDNLDVPLLQVKKLVTKKFGLHASQAMGNRWIGREVSHIQTYSTYVLRVRSESRGNPRILIVRLINVAVTGEMLLELAPAD
jgi:hypothetical protein